MSVPMNAPPPANSSQHGHGYPAQGHQGYVPQSSHSGDMMMAPATHSQPQMMNEHGQMMYHMQPHMKVEH